MKNIKFIFCFIILVLSIQSKAQSYQATNKIVAIVKEIKTKRTNVYSTRGLSVKTDLERNEFNFQVQLNSFVEVDSLMNLSLDSLLPVIDFPMFSFKGQLPFNKLDKDIGSKQTISVQGTFSIGNQNFTTNIPVEFEFMDKQLLFDTYFTLDLAKFNIALPRAFQDNYSNLIEFRIDNGHLISR